MFAGWVKSRRGHDEAVDVAAGVRAAPARSRRRIQAFAAPPPWGRWVLSKRPILVAYLNGQDGKWAVLLARSDEEVRTRFPELEIYSDAPAWMTTLTGPLLERMTVDIDDTDHPFLAAILRRRRPDPSAGP